jgi:WD40 repeat protein
VDSERLRSVEAVFHGAAELRGDAREDFLRGACGSDADLRREVDALLAADDGISGFMSPERRARPSLPVPESMGGYQIIEEIDRGGMGVVYRARQPGLDRVVALKVIISGQLASREEIERFEREARAAAQLDHPHIVPIYEVGASGPFHFFSMKLMDGGTLARPIGALDRSPPAVARLVEKIARAVHFAHERGILHRDLKPANILLDGDGEPHVSDFGLARRLEGGDTLTLSGQLLGTASYMAPEQASGVKGAVTVAADIYSLGAILYELLAGRPPFVADSAFETLRKVVDEEPEPPRRQAAAVPRDLESICLRSLEKSPSNRYPSAALLADDLARFAAGLPVDARPISGAARAWRWCRRHPALAAIASLVLVIAVGASAFSVRLASQGRTILAHLVEARLNEAERSALVPAPGQKTIGLDRIREVAGRERSLRMRNAAAACLALWDVKVDWRRPVFTPTTNRAVLSPSFLLYATGDRDGTIRVCRTESDEELARFGSRGAPDAGAGSPQAIDLLRFSPTERYLASVDRQRGLRFHDWRRREDLFDRAFGVTARVAASFSFHPGGSRAALVDGTSEIQRLDLGARSVLPPLQLGESATGIAWSPDGARLAAAGAGDVLVLDAESGQISHRLPHGGAFCNLAWHPGGGILGFTAGRHVQLWDLELRQRFRAFEVTIAGEPTLAFHPGGEVFATSSYEYSLRLWSLAGENLVRVDGRGEDPYFSSDGSRVGAFRAANEMGVWKLLPSAVCSQVLAQLRSPGPTTVDASGRFLVAGAQVFDLKRHELHRPLPAGLSAYSIFLPQREGIVTELDAGVCVSPLALSRRQGAHGTVEHLRIGPPRLIHQPRPAGIAVSPDGSYVAVTAAHRVRLYETSSGAPLAEFPHLNSTFPAVSPDGRWLASGPLHGEDLRIWDVTGRSPAVVRPGRVAVLSAVPLFSPDGRWLVVSTYTEVQVLEVGRWDAPPKVYEHPSFNEAPLPIAVSPDSRVLARVASPVAIDLTDLESAAELATLRWRDPQVLTRIEVGLDGTALYATSRDHGVRIWDLRRLRRELRELGLDWDAPDLPSERASGEFLPVEIEIDFGDLAGRRR